MNAKENTLRIIRFDHPEQVQANPSFWTIGYHGVNHQSYEETGNSGHWREVGVRWKDIWGTEWEKDQPDVMGFPRGNPLADPAALKDYVWPDPNDPRICDKIYASAEAFRQSGKCDDYLLCGSHRDTLWEKSYMLVGMENMMCYFYEEPEYAHEIFRRIMDFQLGIAEHYVRVGVEAVALGDDMGTQHSLLFSKKIFDEFLLPEYTRLFRFYKERGVIIQFHSCGYIEPLLDTFIALGVDILNPLQATANDLTRVIEKTRGKMALYGAIPTALLIEGPAEEIRRKTRETIALLGQGGGYFCSPDQGMPFPEEHLKALEETVAQYGPYPGC